LLRIGKSTKYINFGDMIKERLTTLHEKAYSILHPYALAKGFANGSANGCG
jgi:hypothetical protein